MERKQEAKTEIRASEDEEQVLRRTEGPAVCQLLWDTNHCRLDVGTEETLGTVREAG